MKRFKQLWWKGLLIVGIPVLLFLSMVLAFLFK
jgi:hypothetical protein